MTQNQPSARTFEMNLDIEAPKELVWNAISQDTELARWFAPEASVTPGEGGEIVWQWNDFFRWPQTIEVWEPGERLMTRYDSPVEDGEGGRVPLFVDFRLEARGEGSTTLRFVHSGFGPEADFDEEYDGISTGWPVELRSLRHYLENHVGRERHLTWSTAVVAQPATEAWARLMGPEGLGFGADVGQAAEGSALSLTMPSGDTLEGHLLRSHPTEVIARIESHDNAFLRLSADCCGGNTHVWMWLATYDGPKPELERLQTNWDALLAGLFPDQVDPSGVTPERDLVSKEG